MKKKTNKKSARQATFLSRDISFKRIGKLLILPVVALASSLVGYHGALNRYNPHTAYENFLLITPRAYVVGCLNSVKAAFESGALPLDKAQEFAQACKESLPAVRQSIEAELTLEWLYTSAEENNNKVVKISRATRK